MNRDEYLTQIKNDIVDYIKENKIDPNEADESELYDDLWVVDRVTGNGSGSYTFNSYEAKKNIEGAGDIIREMIPEFGIEAETVVDKFLNEDYEWFDVSIRCYLLGEALGMALEELRDC